MASAVDFPELIAPSIEALIAWSPETNTPPISRNPIKQKPINRIGLHPASDRRRSLKKKNFPSMSL
jgi:hypothetical protein